MAHPIDSRQLRAFATLARTGSFTRTAQELHLSPSAISHSLRGLEDELRCRLFDRAGKIATLTQAGEQLLVRVERILAEMQAAREDLQQLGQWGYGRLRLSASTTACQYILPNVLREFKESFPNCVIQIEPSDAPQAVEQLRSQRVDLALTIEPRGESQWEFRSLFADELHFIVSPLHPWARAGRVERSDVRKQNFILYTRTSYLVTSVEEYFRREGLVLPSFIEMGNVEAIKEFVKLGLGISILAPWVLARELNDTSLVALPLGRRKLRRNWGILYARGRRLSLPEETFVGLCKTVTESLAGTQPG